MRWNWCWWNITVFALWVFWVVVLASSFATPSGKFLNKIAENCTMKVPTRSGNKLKIGITVCKVTQTRYPCEGSACFGSTASLQRNRPFASSHSRGTKPPYWRARDALGEDKQRTNHAKWSELFAFSVPVRLLFSSTAVLCPMNDKLQMVCCHTIESAVANIFRSGQRVSWSKCKFNTGLCCILPQSNAVRSVIKYSGTAEANTSLVPEKLILVFFTEICNGSNA